MRFQDTFGFGRMRWMPRCIFVCEVLKALYERLRWPMRLWKEILPSVGSSSASSHARQNSPQRRPPLARCCTSLQTSPPNFTTRHCSATRERQLLVRSDTSTFKAIGIDREVPWNVLLR